MSETEDIEVIEVVLRGGSGFTVRSLSMDDAGAPPMLARDERLLLFPTLTDLADFAAAGEEHTLMDHHSWPRVAGSLTAGALAVELLDSYDLTEVPDLVTGDTEDRWTAGLLVTLALDISDTVGCPTLSALGLDAPLIMLEGDSALFEGPKNSMLRRRLSDDTDRQWPGILAEIEERTMWWVAGRVSPRPPERTAADAARRLAQAEASVASLDPNPPPDLVPAAPQARAFPVRMPTDKTPEFERLPSNRPEPLRIDPQRALEAQRAIEAKRAAAEAERAAALKKAAEAKRGKGKAAPVVVEPEPEVDEGEEPADGDAPAPLWDGVDAYPIEIHLPRGVGLTVVGYPDDTSTVFLGRPGEVLVFSDRRDLVAYLLQHPDHSLASLPGWEAMGPLDAAALEPAGFYYLHDVAERLDDEDLDADACSEIADALEIAVELAQQLGVDEVLDELDGTGPLNLYVAALLDEHAMEDFPEVEDAAAQWRRVMGRLDEAITWRD
jgi:hypothetical protein